MKIQHILNILNLRVIYLLGEKIETYSVYKKYPGYINHMSCEGHKNVLKLILEELSKHT